jgi:hypothetical protein
MDLEERGFEGINSAFHWLRIRPSGGHIHIYSAMNLQVT